MKVVIVEDERIAVERLLTLLKQYDESIEVVACLESIDETVQYLKQSAHPDLLLLDIHLADGHSFEIFKQVNYNRPVIFTTAYDEYALKAFEYNALDYLLKPIEPSRLEESIKKLIEGKRKEKSHTLSQETLTAEDQVFVKDGDKCWFVKLDKVRLFESEGNYVRLYFDENKPLILRTLNYLDERLDNKSFFRASRKHIINLKWVENIEPWLNGGLLAKLKGGHKIEVSRRQAVKFKEMLSL